MIYSHYHLIIFHLSSIFTGETCHERHIRRFRPRSAGSGGLAVPPRRSEAAPRDMGRAPQRAAPAGATWKVQGGAPEVCNPNNYLVGDNFSVSWEQ